MIVEIAVDRILVKSATFIIFAGAAADGQRLIVKSAEPVLPAIGEVYQVDGEAKDFRDQRGYVHRQIEARYISRVRISGKLIAPWLRTLPGVGVERARRLLMVYGSEVLDVLTDLSKNEELAAVISPARPNLGRKLVSLIQSRLIGFRTEEEAAFDEGQFYRSLEEYGVSEVRLARRLWRLFGGNQGWAGLLVDPYILAAFTDWKSADEFGKRILVVRCGSLAIGDHPSRLIGACASAWSEILSRGETACGRESFVEVLAHRIPNPLDALSLALKRGLIQEFGHHLCPKGIAFLEREVLHGFHRLHGRAEQVPDVDGLIDRAQTTAGLRMTSEQTDALRFAIKNPVCCLQGGAGTGKTTILRVLVRAWEQCGGDVIIATIAGKAALRASRATGKLAYTMARLMGGIERKKGLSKEGRFDAAKAIETPAIGSQTLIILDEASMVDLAAIRSLLDLAPDGARLVLVGDFGQLPPVGLGQVFHDLVSSGWYTATLSTPLRQAKENPIVAAAWAIRNGLLPGLPPYRGAAQGVFHLPCPTKEIGLRIQRLKRDFPDDVMTITALRATAAAINEEAARSLAAMGIEGQRLGPNCPFVAIGEPVIMSRNFYAHGLMNGQTGTVTAIDPVTIRWDGEEQAREVDPDYIAEIEPAHAITCHRAQGSEADVVIVSLDSAHLITRNWLYTAVTRARKTAIFVGPSSTITDGVAKITSRATGLRLMLEREAA